MNWAFSRWPMMMMMMKNDAIEGWRVLANPHAITVKQTLFYFISFSIRTHQSESKYVRLWWNFRYFKSSMFTKQFVDWLACGCMCARVRVLCFRFTKPRCVPKINFVFKRTFRLLISRHMTGALYFFITINKSLFFFFFLFSKGWTRRVNERRRN